MFYYKQPYIHPSLSLCLNSITWVAKSSIPKLGSSDFPCRSDSATLSVYVTTAYEQLKTIIVNEFHLIQARLDGAWLMSDFATLFLLTAQCVVPSSAAGSLARASNNFFTGFFVPSSLMYPGALWISMIFVCLFSHYMLQR